MNRAEFCRYRREQLGYSRKRLADEAGFSASTVRRFETNTFYDPGDETFIKMAQALKVSKNLLADIFGFDYRGENWPWTNDQFSAKKNLNWLDLLKVRRRSCN